MTASEGATQSSRGDGPRGRSRGRGRGSGAGSRRARRGRGGGGESAQPLEPAARHVAAAAARAHGQQASSTGDDDGEVCFICANPVAHYSIAPCNHTTCHICGLRMRALYKTMDCAICRTPAPFVIFTDDAEKRFEDYSDGDISTTDSNVGIKYSNEDIVGDTVLLLRYNCPDASCDFAGLGWPDLHRHVKSAHGKRMCDLCTRNKKVFTHEHDLFSDADVDKHMRRGDDRPGAADQTGFKGHPLCEFCTERFYDDDKLYEHCRTKHERCFICDRSNSQKPHYYRDYDALEQHFRKDHFPCLQKECLDNKFVVFESRMDLQAHAISAHLGETVGRDARLVDMSSFDIRQSYQHERRPAGRGQRDGDGRGGRGRGGRGGGRGRDPNAPPEAPVLSSAQPLRRDELAFQRQMAIHSAQSVSNRTFGGQLTATGRGGSSSSSSAPPRTARSAAPQSSISDAGMDSLSVADPASMSPEERARLVRHNAVIERAANLVANDSSKLAAFRSHISAYRRGGFTAPQLLDAFFTLFADVSSNALGTLVREVADLFDDRAKADGLRAAWHNWRAINEDYPSLPGLSGMQGATSSSSGWAVAAAASPAEPKGAPSQKHSNRVLRLKNSTRLGPGPSSSSPTASPSSSSAFPSLPASNSSSSSGGGRREPPSSKPSWSGAASSSTPQPPSATSIPLRSATSTPRGRGRGEDAFPALPAAPKPSTTIFGYGSSGRGVRRDFGAQASTGFQWGGAASTSTPSEQEDPDDEADGDPGAGRGRKGGGKKGKRVLVQWG
ncbi:hypothetical protein XA68_11570 [Ophiocordyceps unilateralis]|uniref:RING-type E3 ubiquitin transferase n=1 Tax=Ophiocordyceps unilateralis TaxID=268505 RepID=A0A2A9PGL3_OPHUN|nr:hypothetical protein XA68_11570 [Ophiocordyceps unilateralis]